MGRGKRKNGGACSANAAGAVASAGDLSPVESGTSEDLVAGLPNAATVEDVYGGPVRKINYRVTPFGRLIYLMTSAEVEPDALDMTTGQGYEDVRVFGYAVNLDDDLCSEYGTVWLSELERDGRMLTLDTPRGSRAEALS